MFQAALSLQIEARGKIMGGAQLLGSKSLEISFPIKNFFQLTTPMPKERNKFYCYTVYSYRNNFTVTEIILQLPKKFYSYW